MNNYRPQNTSYTDEFKRSSDVYRVEIDEILQIMDKPDINVDDDTQFWDHYLGVNDRNFKELHDVVERLYNVEISLEDYICETAEKMRKGQIS